MIRSENEISKMSNACFHIVKKNSIREIICNYKENNIGHDLKFEEMFALSSYLDNITEDAINLSQQLPYSRSTCHLILLCCLYTDNNRKTSIWNGLLYAQYKLRSEIATASLEVLFEDMNFINYHKILKSLKVDNLETAKLTDFVTNITGILPSISLSSRELKIKTNLDIIQELSKTPESHEEALKSTILIVLEELVCFYKSMRSNYR